MHKQTWHRVMESNHRGELQRLASCH